MGQVSGKSDPNLPNVGFGYILADYIKPRSPWIEGGIFSRWRSNPYLGLNLRTPILLFHDCFELNILCHCLESILLKLSLLLKVFKVDWTSYLLKININCVSKSSKIKFANFSIYFLPFTLTHTYRSTKTIFFKQIIKAMKQI